MVSVIRLDRVGLHPPEHLGASVDRIAPASGMLSLMPTALELERMSGRFEIWRGYYRSSRPALVVTIAVRQRAAAWPRLSITCWSNLPGSLSSLRAMP
jgi:hypothetical protein